MISGVVSRIKIMSDLDIAEKRVPQDGRVGVNVDGPQVDLRITTLPTQRGEGATIRILDKEQALRTLDDLGPRRLRARRASSRRSASSHGAVLVTGPTGSGKSTTLYASLAELNAVEKNIITIEDPVEYRIDGINQINVNPKAGLSFAAGLRSILRADPDVIMVGEIRDAETARIAIESALTGHMVLSTLHTNNAPGAITRLAEDGDRDLPDRLGARLRRRPAARAQALHRTASSRTVISQAALAQSGFRVGADLEAYEPVGCSAVQPHRLPRPDRDLLGDGDERADQGPHGRAARRRPRSPRSRARRACSTLREDGLTKVRAGRHLDRRARARRLLSPERPQGPRSSFGRPLTIDRP